MNALEPQIRMPWAEPPAEGEATEIAEGLLWMRLPLPMALDHVNVFALDDGPCWSIVDTGFDTKRSRRIWQDLLNGPLSSKPVGRVIVTHHHPDHVGLAGWFQQEFRAELLTTRTAWLFSRMLMLDEQDRPAPETLTYWRSLGFDPRLLEQRITERPFNFADVVAPMPLGFTRIRDGDCLSVGGRDWRVRTGSGHAPEHATLWEEGGNLIIGGDQLLPSISANIGVYATEPDADPLSDWFTSCRAFMPHARADQLILPGHKLPFTGLPLRLSQMIENHTGALARLRDFLIDPRTAHDCLETLFKRRIKDSEYGLAIVEARAHLNYLLATGEVRREITTGGADLWQIRTATPTR